MTTRVWEIYAIHFATDPRRRAAQNFIEVPSEINPDATMPMDFYCWVLRCEDETILVDTGFSAAQSQNRNKTYLRDPLAAIRRGGIDLDQIADVVVTHLHYDHAGNMERLPHSRVHLQQAEIDFATAPETSDTTATAALDPIVTAEAQRRRRGGGLVLHRGSYRLRDGIDVLLSPGHTPGSQIVVVATAQGPYVLASDTVHLWPNLRLQAPFAITSSVEAVLASMDMCLALAGSVDRVIPGHEPLIRSVAHEIATGLGWYGITTDVGIRALASTRARCLR